MIPLWTAISLGLVSSLHCMGMCGPIAMALPLKKRTYFTVWSGIGAYNLGRITTYMVLGVLFGLLGKAFFTAGLQRSVSVILGVLFLLSVIVPATSKRVIPMESLAYRTVGKLMARSKKLFGKYDWESLFLIGTLNGLLPCGMVYLALAGATASGTWDGGALYMLLFGAGTVPAMIAVTWAGRLFTSKLRLRFRKAVPIMVAVLGVIFILRGLDLDIPYLSPEILPLDEGVTECH